MTTLPCPLKIQTKRAKEWVLGEYACSWGGRALRNLFYDDSETQRINLEIHDFNPNQ